MKKITATVGRPRKWSVNDYVYHNTSGIEYIICKGGEQDASKHLWYPVRVNSSKKSKITYYRSDYLN